MDPTPNGTQPQMGLNSERTEPRLDSTPTGLNLDWTQPRLGLNPDWTELGMGLNPDWTQPRISFNLEYGVQWCISKECI
jgi:hypothetical protein